MRYLWTAFDKLAQSEFSPLASAVFDDETKELDFYALHLKGAGENAKLSDIRPRTNYIKSLFDGPLVVNDFKNHITAFGLPINKNFDVYEMPEDQDATYPKTINDLRKYLIKQIINARAHSPKRWQSLLAEATVVYLDLERRGVLKDDVETHPIYELTTFTGRSKSMGFSIQGAVEGDEITSTDRNQKAFICADWIAADPRGWALLSNDEAMQESYKKSDPYSYLAEKHGGTRADYKNELIKSIYSQNYGSVVFKSFPQLKEWVSHSWEQIVKDGYSTSVLGRKFYGPRGMPPSEWTPHIKRSIFNAQMQGSTAHAMQNVMVELHRRIPHSLMTELHDSVVLCTDKGSVPSTIEIVTEVMLHPFNGIIPSNPAFPLRVSVGNQWKKWRQLREYRE